MSLPEQVDEEYTDDVQDIDVSLDALVKKFIDPIERLRSFASPASLKNQIKSDSDIAATNLNASSFNQNEPQESRAHVFYRMIGLPVISSVGFYNPGFNPVRGNAINNRINIASNIDNNITVSHTARETAARTRQNIFKTGGLNATSFAASMILPKPLQNMDAAKKFSDIDEQKYNVPDRKDFLQSIYVKLDGSDLGTSFTDGVHILRPFCVDPTLESIVMPAEKMVCEPFLVLEKHTKLEANKKLLRPGIELILRLRLSQQPNNEDAIANTLVFTLDPEQDISGLTKPQIVDLVNALFAKNEINGNRIDELSDITAYEVNQLNQSIKTIKALIKKLIDSIYVIDNTMRNTVWAPNCSIRGPEDYAGMKNDGVMRYRNGLPELDKRILNLELKVEESTNVGDPEFALSDYAISTFESMKRDYAEDLAVARGEKAALEKNAFKALSAIEYITGEISGLGLIDILAVYATLWAIDLDVLLSLLDEAAFKRLYIGGIVNGDKGLRGPDVERRNSEGPAYSGVEALQRFEAQVLSVLAFADAEFENGLKKKGVETGAKP